MRQLLTQGVFEIPPYQRDFAWEDEQVAQFFKVLGNDQEPTFFGNMIFLEQDRRDRDQAVQEVVDGQQRLTTVFMTLGIIRNKLLEVTQSELDVSKATADDYEAVAFAKELHSAFINIDETQKSLEGTNSLNFNLSDGKPRFQGNDSIASLIHKHVTQADPEEWPKKAPRGKRRTVGEKNLYKAAVELEKNFDKELEKYPDKSAKQKLLQRVGKTLLDRIYVLPLRVKTQRDAYEVFISENERGVRLGTTDLMKTELMKLDNAESGGKNIEKIEEKWKKMKGNADGRFDSFMRHTLSGYFQESLTKREMMKKFLEGSVAIYKVEDQEFESTKNLLSKGSLDAASQLERFSDFYAEAVGAVRKAEDPEVDQYLELLNSLLETHLIFSTQLLASDLPKPEKVEALKNALSLAGRWSLVAGNRQELEDMWVRAVQGLDHGANDRMHIVELNKKMPTDKEVKNAFTQTPKDEAQAKAILKIIEDLVLNNALKRTVPQITLEHIAPENPSEPQKEHWYQALGIALPTKDEEDSSKINEYAELVARWGNLTLLSKPENSSLKDVPFDIKVKGRNTEKKEEIGYRNSVILLNKFICDRQPLVWDEKAILERESELASRALTALPRLGGKA